ncbi:hypothetical protein AAF712_016689 [Marasmius tenuissimus]|uniref:Uncharacterized protein n=1 Tax=Marasmius tenuissimus TaxID=585030 RepID=A0ABR2Z655_9AGAR
MSSHPSSARDTFLGYSGGALLRFQNIEEALEELRRTQPPSVSTINISNSGRRIEAACQAMNALACYMEIDVETTSSHIIAHWDRFVSKWIIFFLQNTITSFESASTLGAEPNILEYFLFALPALLDYENNSMSMRSLRRRASMYIQPLVTHIWLFLIEEDPDYNLTRPWSTVLVRLMTGVHINKVDSPSSLTSSNRATLTRTKPKWPNWIHSEQAAAALGKKLLIALDLRIERVAIKRAHEADVSVLNDFVILLGARNRRRHFQRTGPQIQSYPYGWGKL